MFTPEDAPSAGNETLGPSPFETRIFREDLDVSTRDFYLKYLLSFFLFKYRI